MQPRLGAWISEPSTSIGEIIAELGYDFVVLDVEHGVFDIQALERFLPLLKGLGLEVLCKVLGPERGPLQQALDFGADGVVIPHIEGYEHAKTVTEYAKFFPMGSRSLAGGRTMRYGGFDLEWIERQNAEIKVFPMVEDPIALAEVSQIAMLPSVDGIFIGPGDLALLSGRGAYARTDADYDEFERIITAVRAAGKQWVMPAWSDEEKRFALDREADYVVLTMQHPAVAEGYRRPLRTAHEMLGRHE